MPKLNKDENGINTYNLDDVFEIQPEIDYLSNHFNTFIYKDPKDFFLGIADYIRHIVENDDLKFIKKEYDENYEHSKKSFENAKTTLINRLNELIGDLDYATYEHKIDNDIIEDSLDNYKHTREASILDVHKLYECAKKAVDSFISQGFYTPTNDFVELDEEMINVAEYSFSKEYDAYKDAEDTYNERLETETWAYWQTAFEIYKLAYEFREHISSLRNKNDVEGEKDFRSKHAFYKLTREGKDVDANPFKTKRYEYKVEKLHNDIIKKLAKLTKITQKDIDFNKKMMESLNPQIQMINKAVQDAFNLSQFSQPFELPDLYGDNRQTLRPIRLTEDTKSVSSPEAAPGEVKNTSVSIVWGDLHYDFPSCELRYKGKVLKGISPDRREVKFMMAVDLYSKRGLVAYYKDIAKHLLQDTYIYETNNGAISHEELKNDLFARDVGYIRRDFRKLCLSAGMSGEDFKLLLETIKNTGYRLTIPR
jgi:hypothetical protein